MRRGGGRRSAGVRTAGVWDALRPVLDQGPLDVIDVGGGTGHFAVPLAELGHRVTVVDPNPDALAALERRADEAGVIVVGHQADAHDLMSVLDGESADLVLCHSVLEYVEDPAAALRALVAVLRPGGTLSVLVAGALAAVLHRAASGHFEDAQRALTRPDGRWGDHDPVPHRFGHGSLHTLAVNAGLEGIGITGVRVFADLVPAGLIDSDPQAAEALRSLEAAAAGHPVLRELATRLHLSAHRPL
ncbi:methyltransferase [Actinocorallia longicatena]|uniref:Methyltransferase n=1 Tax=Actinocorallia longicatena TaxID=111803 RepID=A0ABP6QS61_9ACTN